MIDGRGRVQAGSVRGPRPGSTPWLLAVVVVVLAGACSGSGADQGRADASGASVPDTPSDNLPGSAAAVPEATSGADRAALEAFRAALGGEQGEGAQQAGGRFVMSGVATSDSRLFMVGDSVLEAAWPTAAALLPSWRVTADAEVGRRMTDGIGVVDHRRSDIGDVAVVVLGHNYTVGEGFEAQFERMMRSLSDLSRVVWVTPAEWSDGQAEVGSVIRMAPARFPNVVVADWAALSGENPGYLQGDGVHLTVAGVVALADLVARSVGPGPLDGGPGVLLMEVPSAPTPVPVAGVQGPGPAAPPEPRSPRTTSTVVSSPTVTGAPTSTTGATTTTVTATTTSIPPTTGTLPP